MSAPGLGYWNEQVQAWLSIVEYGRVIVTSMVGHGRVIGMSNDGGALTPL